ncbi:LytTR family DNA-binding domain-containing protein, partial [Clostridiaceae bacterium HSG29]|nr:LytTR family DNA-binding domain-containing protein [Clostridiaceae bacterium HSG29]
IYHLSKFQNINVLNDFDDGIEAINFLTKNNVDLVFLDINMTTQNGIDIAKNIKSLNLPKFPYIVFVTAYDEFAIKAFDLDVIDYILKPIDDERFSKCITKITKEFENISIKKSINLHPNDEIITLIKNNILYPIKKNQIKLAYIEDRSLTVETVKGKFIITGTLNEFEETLPKDIFLRIHRSYLINVNYIEEIIPWFNSTFKVKLIGCNMEIPVSRNQTQDFKRRMSIM